MDYKKIYKKIEKRYIVIGIILILLFLSRQIIVQRQINLGKDMSQAINISGRQRMLSQRITKDVLIIHESEGVYPVKEYLDDLELSLDKFQNAQYNLINYNEKDNIITSNSDTIITMFNEIDPCFTNIVESGNTILNAFKQGNYNNDLIVENIKSMISSENLFLKKMDKIVSQYEDEAENGILQIENIERIIFYLVIFSFIFVVIFILIPTTKVLRTAFIDVNESNVNIKKLFHTMKGALFVVNKDGHIITNNLDAEDMKIVNNMDIEGTNIEDVVKWLDINIMNLIKDVMSGERIDNLEVKIEDSDEAILTFLVSASNTLYNQENTVLIGAYDITNQKKAEELLKNMAIKDELTGLYNRHFLDLIIREEINKSNRYDYPISVAIFDIDDFKKINDTWGHPIGDHVLKELAKTLTEHSRNSDYHVRIGGEEFVILMPHTNLEGAYIVAEKLRKIIENKVHHTVGKYTVSVGLAQRKPNEAYPELYNRMDSALYKAKRTGKNCVVKSIVEDTNDYSYPLEWSKSWECGEENIDFQHRQIFDIVQKKIKNKKEIRSKEDRISNLQILLKHVEDHFSYENKVLKETGYANALEHKKIHDDLLAKSYVLKEKAINEEISYEEVLELMSHDLITGHLLKEDTKFFKHIKNHKSCVNPNVKHL